MRAGWRTVYLARDEKHNRNVALKVLKPELAAVVGADRFLAEIETTANLQHPHILPLFDSGEADSFLFYVMPYVEGESLRERLDREHQLPVDEAVAIATKVAGALQAAHERGVVHRDIKPANILLSKGEPLVSDFGIALALGAAGGGRMTETGLSLGTPHYMSPEQATGDLNIGAATDTYALGCVLYEMLVGEPPFTGGTPQAVLGKIVTGQAPSASAERSLGPAERGCGNQEGIGEGTGGSVRFRERGPRRRWAILPLGTAWSPRARAPGRQGRAGRPRQHSRSVLSGWPWAPSGRQSRPERFAPNEPEGVMRFAIEPGEDASFDPSEGVGYAQHRDLSRGEPHRVHGAQLGRLRTAVVPAPSRPAGGDSANRYRRGGNPLLLARRPVIGLRETAERALPHPDPRWNPRLGCSD